MSDVVWGAQVLVRAEVVRVISEPAGGGHRFKQASSRREAGRLEQHDFTGVDVWPGAPIVADWAETTAMFKVEPSPNGSVLARLRRLEWPTHEVGLVIGHVNRWEGRIVAVDGRNSLEGPHRRVQLLEVSLRPAKTSKARIVLAHRHDVWPLTTAAPAWLSR